MSGWIYIVIFIGLLIGLGLFVDWRRKHSTRGLEERSAKDLGTPGYDGGGGGCGST